MELLWILFLEFFKIGIFSVGGGLATLPYLFEISNKYQWYTHAQLVDMIAISQSTPGPIGVNTATYAGYQASGIVGGIVATLGIFVAGLIVASIISKMFEKFKNNRYVQFAFYGIRPAVAGLVLASAFDIILGSLFDFKVMPYINIWGIIAFSVVLYCLNKTKIHPVLLLLVCGLCGIFIPF
ncbi:MAG: chromate transporter [Erysipelotrichaceae bacterium]